MIEYEWRGAVGKHLQPVWLATLTGTNSGTDVKGTDISKSYRREKGTTVSTQVILYYVLFLKTFTVWMFALVIYDSDIRKTVH